MAQPWGTILALSAGGVLGVNARYWLGFWFSRWVTQQFPWATFVINISGSFAIGLLTVTLARWLPHPTVRLFALVGFLGGYTTFSTFAFDSLTLWERGEVWLSLANMVGSTAAGFVAVALGVGMARALVMPIHERPASAIPRGTALPRNGVGRAASDGQKPEPGEDRRPDGALTDTAGNASR